MPWRRKSIAWCLQPLAIIWWHVGVVSGCLGWVPWSWYQLLRSGDEIPPHIIWFSVRSSWWLPWRGDTRIFHCPLCRSRLWFHGWQTGVCRPPWRAGSPLLRLLSSCGRSINMISGPQKQCLPRTVHGLGIQWLGGRDQAQQRKYGQWRSWLMVWYWKVSWWIRLSACLWSYIVSCGIFQICRPHRGVNYLP